MARISIVFVILFIVITVIEVHGHNSTERNEIGKTNSSITQSEDDSRKISKRNLRTVHLGYYNPKRGRFVRNKPPRKSKPNRRPPVIHHDVSSSEYLEGGYKNRLKDDRRNRHNNPKEETDSYESYYNHPDLGNLGEVFNEDEIRDLFLTTKYDYSKFVRDYNNKLRSYAYPVKSDRPFKYSNEILKDSDYDFSEVSNPDSDNDDSTYYHKHYSKYKKNDATQQLTPVGQYEVENVKDFGVHQNSYGEYPTLSPNHFDQTETQTYASNSNHQTFKNYLDNVKNYNNYELLKVSNKTNAPSFNNEYFNTDLYSNNGPSFMTYANEYNNFNTKPVQIKTNYQSENTNSNKFNQFYQEDNSAANNFPTYPPNYASDFSFDSKIHDLLPTKYSLNEWNQNLKSNVDFEKQKNAFSNIDATIETDVIDHNKKFTLDFVNQFYEMNNLQNPSFGSSFPVTAKPLNYDQNYVATSNYEIKDANSWRDEGGWKVLDSTYSASTQKPVEVYQPIIVPVPQPYPVRVPVTKPVAVPIVKEIKVPVEKEVPYPVVKNVHYPVEKPVPVKVEKQVTVKVPKPYPVKIPVFRNIYHHTDESRPHTTEEWETESNHEHWNEDDAVEEGTAHKESYSSSWKNSRANKSKRKNNNADLEDYELEQSRPKMRKPMGPRRPINKGRQRNNRNRNNRNRMNNRRKKHATRPRKGNMTKRLSITRHVDD